MDEKKELEFYKAGISAWFSTALERDKSLLTLSASGIGLLVTLGKFNGIGTIESLVLHILAIISFLICLVCVLIILGKNKLLIEQALNGDKTDSLKNFDSTAVFSFAIAIILSTIIGISAAINSYTTNTTKEHQMTNENNKNLVPTSPANTNEIIQKVSNGELSIVKESFEGISKLKPQNQSPCTPVTDNQKSKKD